MKATHIGTCQCCGAQQKLPSGVLAKHGYTVEYSFFNGICQGTGHKPFEKSFDLIEQFIHYAQSLLDINKVKRAKYLQPAIEPKAWIHEYHAGGYKFKSGYQWREVEITEQTNTNQAGDYSWKTYHYVDYTGKPAKLNSYDFPTSILDLCTKQNAQFVSELLNKEIAELERYIKWQQGRIATWTEQSLIEIKKD